MTSIQLKNKNPQLYHYNIQMAKITFPDMVRMCVLNVSKHMDLCKCTMCACMCRYIHVCAYLLSTTAPKHGFGLSVALQ